jgi:hypothetical protein
MAIRSGLRPSASGFEPTSNSLPTDGRGNRARSVPALPADSSTYLTVGQLRRSRTQVADVGQNAARPVEFEHRCGGYE